MMIKSSQSTFILLFQPTLPRFYQKYAAEDSTLFTVPLVIYVPSTQR